MNKRSFLSNIKYFIIAVIILVLGYFFGIIILAIIAIIILLMSILFILSLIFHKSIDFFLNKRVRLFLTMLFSLGLTYGILKIFWNLILKIENINIIVILIWTITALIFGTFWNLFIIRKRISYKNKVIDYSEPKIGVQVKDIIFITLISTIFTITISILNNLIVF